MAWVVFDNVLYMVLYPDFGKTERRKPLNSNCENEMRMPAEHSSHNLSVNRIDLKLFATTNWWELLDWTRIKENGEKLENTWNYTKTSATYHKCENAPSKTTAIGIAKGWKKINIFIIENCATYIVCTV